MSSFNNKHKGLSFMQFYEPLFISLLNQHYFSRYGITIHKNPDQFGVDALFIHPRNREEYGVELKTTKTYFRGDVSNFAVYEGNESGSGTNEIYKYMKVQKIILAYLDWQRWRFLIVHDKAKMEALYNFNEDVGLARESIRIYGNGWRMRLIPIDENVGWFDDIIYLDENDASCKAIEEYLLSN